MFILLFLVSVAIIIIMIKLAKYSLEKARERARENNDYVWGERCGNRWDILSMSSFITAGVCTIVSIILFCNIIINIDRCVDSRYIDDTIAMYQEENKNIESDVSEIVKQYQNHETEVFDMSKINSPATLIQMYPELKSNYMVTKQIDIFNENNKKIKSLKLDKINCEKAKFLLYFGG